MICRVLSTTPLDVKKVPLFLLLQTTWSLVFHYLLTDLSFRFSWYYNHQVLDSQDYSLSVVSPDAFTSSLSFSNLTTRHSGNYTCEARNAASFHMHSAHLIVNGNDFFRIFSVRGKGFAQFNIVAFTLVRSFFHSTTKMGISSRRFSCQIWRYLLCEMSGIWCSSTQNIMEACGEGSHQPTSEPIH